MHLVLEFLSTTVCNRSLNHLNLCARCMIFRNSWDVHISCGDEVERERERERERGR
jgi:hypothetical protein